MNDLFNYGDYNRIVRPIDSNGLTSIETRLFILQLAMVSQHSGYC